MFSVRQNDALRQNFTTLGLLVAEKKRGQTQTHTQTNRQDSCFIIIDVKPLSYELAHGRRRRWLDGVITISLIMWYHGDHIAVNCGCLIWLR